MKKLRHLLWLVARPLLDVRYKLRAGALIEEGVSLRYPTGALLAAQHCNGTFIRKEIGVCQLALEDTLRGAESGPHLFQKLQLDDTPRADGQEHWRGLVAAVCSGTIDLSHCAIDVDPSLHVVRGAPWLVLALRYGVPEVTLRMWHKNILELRNDAWLAERGFSADEIAQVNESIREILTRAGLTRLLRPDLKALHDRIDNLFRSEHQTFGGKDVLYQSCEAVERNGQRPTNRRFEIYGLESILKTSDRVLDIGCNCGFLALRIAEYVAHVDGVEIKPSLIQIGETVRDFLGIRNCTFYTAGFNDFSPTTTYDLILSFAVHFWIGMPMQEYAHRLGRMLVPSGLVLLESQDITKLDLNFQAKLSEFCSAGFVELTSSLLCDDGVNLRRFVFLRKS